MSTGGPLVEGDETGVGERDRGLVAVILVLWDTWGSIEEQGCH